MSKTNRRPLFRLAPASLQVHFQMKNEQFIQLSVELVMLHLLCHNCAWLGCSAFIDEDNGIMMSQVRVSITVAKFILSLIEDHT